MVTKGVVSSLAAVVTALALSACARVQPQPVPHGTAAPAESPAAIPTTSVPTPATGPSASDLNRKLLSQASSGEEGDLPLGAGDLIEVAVFEVSEFQGLKLRIPNGGAITLPLIGAVTGAGRTALELQSDIRTRLQEKYLHDPQVTVFVHEHKSQRISVIGAVRTGGLFTLTTRLRLADALALAGGLTDDAGPSVYVIRRVPAQLVSTKAVPDGATEQVMTAIDLQSLASGKEELNLPLQSGDVIEVPRAGTYYVGGEVNRAGSYLLKTRTTLAQASVLAGGLKEAADWDDVRVYRMRADGTREVQTFSLNKFEKGEPAPEIQAGDIVTVGKSNVKAFLYTLRDIIKIGVGATATLFP